jgi:hypothetical protein
MLPGHRADAVLEDLALDLDERRHVLGMLPRQVGQQALEGEGHVALAGSGLQHVLRGHDELVQTLHHVMEDVGGDETSAQDFLSPLCPHGVHLFASSHCPVDTGCCLEAMVRTICYGCNQGQNEEIQ